MSESMDEAKANDEVYVIVTKLDRLKIKTSLWAKSRNYNDCSDVVMFVELCITERICIIAGESEIHIWQKFGGCKVHTVEQPVKIINFLKQNYWIQLTWWLFSGKDVTGVTTWAGRTCIDVPIQSPVCINRVWYLEAIAQWGSILRHIQPFQHRLKVAEILDTAGGGTLVHQEKCHTRFHLPGPNEQSVTGKSVEKLGIRPILY